MLTKEEIDERFVRMTRSKTRQFNLETDNYIVDMTVSHKEALEKIKWLKTVINNIVEQIPLAILDKPLK